MNQLVPTTKAPSLYKGFSVGEFAEMLSVGAFDDMRVELVEGEFERMSPAQSSHSRMNAQLASLLTAAMAVAGREVGTDLAVGIDDSTLRGIDVAVGRSVFAAGIVAAADVFLAVEIADTTLARDLGRKAHDYARGGIAHYWVVDLNARAVHVMGEPGADGYALRSVTRFGEPLAVPGTSETITL